MDLRQAEAELAEKAETERGRKIHAGMVLAVSFLALFAMFTADLPSIFRGGFLIGASLLLMFATPNNF